MDFKYKNINECNDCNARIKNCPAYRTYWQATYNSKHLSEAIAKQYNLNSSEFEDFIKDNTNIVNNIFNNNNQCNK